MSNLNLLIREVKHHYYSCTDKREQMANIKFESMLLHAIRNSEVCASLANIIFSFAEENEVFNNVKFFDEV